MTKRVLVGMSWWVDSAVTAYLLKQQGYEVAAGFMKNFAEPENPNCHTREDRNMAIKVAHHLGIKTFLIFDFRKEYNERIIDYIYEGYQKGITPNPDVFCNNLIKFDVFLEEAEKLGFDYVAMGHYVKIVQNGNEFELHRGVDRTKDQSYFLSWLNQNQLSKALLPLGVYHKEEIRKIAKEIELPNFDRKDSQWLCFIGKTPIKDFLKKRLPIKKGDIIDTEWNKVGEHEWAYFFTLGQSRWLDINIKAFVTKIDVKNNIVTVSYEKENNDLSKSELYATSWHWIGTPPTLPSTIQTKIRYRQNPPHEATISEVNANTMKITFKEPQRAIAPWQIVVAYKGEKVIWNWIISSK